jgi:serine/threonine-protein kinase
VVVEEPHDDAATGEVFGQDPEPGSILPEDADVSITVSTGPEEPEAAESEPEDDDEARDEDGDRDRDRGPDESSDEDRDPDRGRDDDRDDDQGEDDAAASCSSPGWHPNTQYDTGDRVQYQGREYEARWWVQGSHHRPGDGGDWGPWADLGPC